MSPGNQQRRNSLQPRPNEENDAVLTGRREEGAAPGRRSRCCSSRLRDCCWYCCPRLEGRTVACSLSLQTDTRRKRPRVGGGTVWGDTKGEGSRERMSVVTGSYCIQSRARRALKEPRGKVWGGQGNKPAGAMPFFLFACPCFVVLLLVAVCSYRRHGSRGHNNGPPLGERDGFATSMTHAKRQAGRTPTLNQ